MRTKSLSEAIEIKKKLNAEYYQLEIERENLSMACERGDVTDEMRAQYHRIVERLGELDVSELLLADLEVKRQTALRAAVSWTEAVEYAKTRADEDECFAEHRLCLKEAQRISGMIEDLS